jgi:hypothetical protein
MLLNEVLDIHSDVDADVLVEHLETAMVMELFGGLRGVAGAAAGAVKKGMDTARNAYNDGEVKSLLSQLDKYKQQLRGLIQNNPHAFAGNQATTVPAPRRVDPAMRQAVRTNQIAAKQQARGPQVEQPLTNIARREQQAGSVYPARRRLSGNDIRDMDQARAKAAEEKRAVPGAAPEMMQRRGMVSNATAPGVRPQRKPHIKLKSPRAHMEGYTPDVEILNELLGGLGGVFGAAKDAVKSAGRGIGNSYAKGEAKIILNKMISILSQLKERGYQPPPELLRDFKTLQQAAQ